MRALLLIFALVSPAFADDKPDLGQLLTNPSGAAFSLTDGTVPAKHAVKNVVGAFASNKKSFWAAGDVVNDKGTVDGHASAVWDHDKTGWTLIAYSLVPTTTAKAIAPPKIESKNTAGDEYFLTIFDDVWGQDAAETVTKAKDAVLFGSAPNERFVGGAAMNKALTGWNLKFKIRDGRVTGKTSGRLLWMVANMDATSGKSTTPYRVFLVFQGDSDGGYSLVHASFAAMTGHGWGT
ncbi:MAG: hypothetical protein QM831_21090 [Kofleriaceae bacterium]